MPQTRSQSKRARLVVIAGWLMLGAALVIAGTIALADDPPNDDSATAVEADIEPDSTTVEPEPTTTTTTEPTTTTAPPRTDQIFVVPGGDPSSDGRSAERPIPSPQQAVDLAQPGDTILIGAGTYPPLVIDSKSDLTVLAWGAEPVAFTSGTYDADSAIRVSNSSDIAISGLTAFHSLWGVTIEASDGVVLENSTVYDIGQEAVAARLNSTNVTIRSNSISDTGNREGIHEPSGFAFSSFGEGIYLGTGGVLADGVLDETSGVEILGNTISFTSAEAIDVKPSVHDVVVRGNTVHDIATANSGAIVVGIGTRLYPDPNVVIEGNVISAVTTTSPWSDANGIRISAPAIVRHNVIWDTDHSGIFVDADLMSANGGQVVVQRNVIVDSRYEPLRVLSPIDGIPVTLLDNTLGDEAAVLFEAQPGATPMEKAAALLESLESVD